MRYSIIIMDKKPSIWPFVFKSNGNTSSNGFMYSKAAMLKVIGKKHESTQDGIVYSSARSAYTFAIPETHPAFNAYVLLTLPLAVDAPARKAIAEQYFTPIVTTI